MARRFDEVDLLPVPELKPVSVAPPAAVEPPGAARVAAPRWRRFLALAIDLSLFLALGLVLSPLLPLSATLGETFATRWPVVLGHAGFLLLVSYYYFTGSWLIWGKTVGAAIFDVRVVSEDGTALSASAVTRRWAATLLSLATAGAGFVPALLPGGRSAADRFSRTRSMRSA